jgi:hypothetical protein
MKPRDLMSIATLAAGALLCSSAFAQPPFVQSHPMVSEVDQRIQNQDNYINQLEKNGKLTSAQAQQDLAIDQKIQRQLNADVAKNGGHITPDELMRLNQKENANISLIDSQGNITPPPSETHPLINEVDERIQTQENAVNALEAKGKISAFEAQVDLANDQKIQTQLNAAATKNGGYITPKQLGQLNQEEGRNRWLINQQASR